MTHEFDLTLPDGRTLHAYDAGGNGLPVFWHHGTPGLGSLPVPLEAVAAQVGIRWLGYDRPGYGASSRSPVRDVASAAADVSALADELGVDRFAVLGASGGAPHALACATLLPDRVIGAVSIAALAPFGAAGLDWFAGMYAGGEAELRAAVAGADALGQHLAGTEFDPDMFTAADHDTLTGEWGWLGSVAGAALNSGLDGMIDDDLAFVSDWGFDPAHNNAPTLLLHGAADKVVPPAHARWLGARLPAATLRVVDGAGHVSVMAHVADACRRLAGLE